MKYVKYLVVFLSLLGVFFLVLSIGIKKRGTLLKICDHYDVESVDIYYNSHSLYLEMDVTTGEWFLQSGAHKDMAYGKSLETLTKVICYLPFTEEFKLEKPLIEDELRSYGLFENELTVSAKTRNGTEIFLKFGDATPSGTEVYNVNSKTPHLYTIPNEFSDMFKLSYLELLPRTPFSDLKKAGTQSLKINYQGREWSLAQDQEMQVWHNTGKMLSDEQAQEIIDLATSLRYEKYHGPLADDQKNLYGFDYPDVTFSWTKNDGAVFNHGIISLNNANYLTYHFDNEDYLLILTGEKVESLLELLRTLLTQEPVLPETTP